MRSCGARREGTDVLAFRPLSERFRLALMRHLESRGHVLLQPQHQIPQEARRLGLIGGLGVLRGSRCEVEGRGSAFECGTKAIICTAQAQKDSSACFSSLKGGGSKG